MPTLIPLEHPGVILKEEFIDELDLSVYKVLKGTGINQTALGEITKGKRNISPINALKLANFFGLSEDYFATLQTHYNLDCAKRTGDSRLSKVVPFSRKRTNEDAEDLLEA